MRTDCRTGARMLLLGCAGLLFSAFVFAQSNTRLREGDLVEFDGAYGSVIGEVISGPDPSIYYLLAIPGQEDFAIHREKLRLLQGAGASNAGIDIGAAVKWTRAEVAHSGRVVKVNGAWCQVESSSTRAIIWLECETLKQ